MSMVLSNRLIKATRKPHQCFGCLYIIPAGSPAHYQTGVDDGFWSIYLCPGCKAYVDDPANDFWDDRQDGFGPGDVREDAAERESNFHEDCDFTSYYAPGSDNHCTCGRKWAKPETRPFVAWWADMGGGST